MHYKTNVSYSLCNPIQATTLTVSADSKRVGVFVEHTPTHLKSPLEIASVGTLLARVGTIASVVPMSL